MRERLVMYMPNNIHTPIWTSAADERFGLGPYMMVGDMLFAFKEDGELFVYRVSAQSMTLLKRQRVMEEGIDAWGPMAYADGYLIVRDSKTIKCLKVFEEDQPQKLAASVYGVMGDPEAAPRMKSVLMGDPEASEVLKSTVMGDL